MIKPARMRCTGRCPPEVCRTIVSRSGSDRLASVCVTWRWLSDKKRVASAAFPGNSRSNVGEAEPNA